MKNFNKKNISCLFLATLCIVTPLSVNALEVGYENKDFRYENPTPVQEYAIERGIYTDRFLFLMVIHTR